YRARASDVPESRRTRCFARGGGGDADSHSIGGTVLDSRCRMHGYVYGGATVRRLSLFTALAVSVGQPAHAQSMPARPPTGDSLPAEIVSLGQPRLWQPFVTGGLSSNERADGTRAALSAGVFRDITNPVIGLLGWRAELHAGVGRTPTQGA